MNLLKINTVLVRKLIILSSLVAATFVPREFYESVDFGALIMKNIDYTLGCKRKSPPRFHWRCLPFIASNFVESSAEISWRIVSLLFNLLFESSPLTVLVNKVFRSKIILANPLTNEETSLEAIHSLNCSDLTQMS